MRLKCSAASAKERLVTLVTEGFQLLVRIRNDYGQKKEAKTYSDDALKEYEAILDEWAKHTLMELTAIFPTELEAHLFANPETPMGTVSGDYRYQSFVFRVLHFVRGLNRIRIHSIDEYTDMPPATRLYVEDIDSFQRVRDVNPAMVADM